RWTHYVLLVGHRNPPQISVEGLKRTLAEEDVRRDLEEIGMTDPYKILATFLTSADQMSPLLAGNDLNTENFPILEFSVPKFDTGPWSAQRNLNLLRQFHSSVRPWLSVQTTSEDLEKIDRYQQAAHQILRAQEAERLTQVETATRAYLAALKLTPEDQAIAKALEFPELQRVAEEGQPTACLLLGRSRQIRGDFEQARDYFDAFRENLSRLTPPQNSEETQLVQQARAWAPWEEQWRAELRMESKEAGDENEVP
ncbi:MAG: hypothetical protein KDA80_10610, partial [Planctomycetaceae bacterium]|nr:hypothetical protein [Planctomycetaceae bacterium]